MNKNLIVYGGSFNPPTVAHQKITKYLSEKYPDKEIIVLPTSNNFKKNMETFDDRMAMSAYMCEGLKNVSLSDYGCNESEQNGTYHTLKHFKNPYFVLGADVLCNMVEWTNGALLIKENNFIIFPRYNINIYQVLKENRLEEYYNNFTIVDDFKETIISSSLYRQTKDSSLISKEVKEYIDKHNLYK